MHARTLNPPRPHPQQVNPCRPDHPHPRPRKHCYLQQIPVMRIGAKKWVRVVVTVRVPSRIPCITLPYSTSTLYEGLCVAWNFWVQCLVNSKLKEAYVSRLRTWFGIRHCVPKTSIALRAHLYHSSLFVSRLNPMQPLNLTRHKQQDITHVLTVW